MPLPRLVRIRLTAPEKVRVSGLEGMLLSCEISLPSEGTSVTVGLRPQNLKLSAAETGLTVGISEQLGGVAYDYLITPTGECLVGETKNNEVFPEESHVAVSFADTEALFFDANTGARLR